MSNARIRLAVPEDAEQIAAIYARAVTESATSFEIVPPDAAEMTNRMSAIVERYPWLVADDRGTVMGYAYGSTHRARYAYQWSAEVSAYVHRDHHRKGIGRGLYESLFSILALQGYRTAVAGLTLPNEASEEFHKSLGFSVIGVFHKIGYKNNAWHDTLWLERPLAPYDTDIPQPMTMAHARRDPAFDAALERGEQLL
ncbi:MAG TPA: GNAT family N-acetyltransferase [Gemmatimonadaceae bacterium]|nr:GNAT family N-acetyltransferase [Gemmatimonadaceae bacterium]